MYSDDKFAGGEQPAVPTGDAAGGGRAPERGGTEEVRLDEPVPERRRRSFGDTPLETEVVRVRRSNDFDDPPFDVDNDDDETAPETDGDDSGVGDSEEESGEQPRRERFRLIRQIFLGTILNHDYIRENYRYAVLIAFMLFFSIVMLFSSLGAYIRYTTLDGEVRLLRERAIRMSEQRYEQSSHSAVVRRLKERNINLIDPAEPRVLLDD